VEELEKILEKEKSSFETFLKKINKHNILDQINAYEKMEPLHLDDQGVNLGAETKKLPFEKFMEWFRMMKE